MKTEPLASAVMAAQEAQAEATPPTAAVVAVVATMAAAAAGLAAPMTADTTVPVGAVVAAARPTSSRARKTCVCGKGGKIRPLTGWSSLAGRTNENLNALSSRV